MRGAAADVVEEKLNRGWVESRGSGEALAQLCWWTKKDGMCASNVDMKERQVKVRASI